MIMLTILLIWIVVFFFVWEPDTFMLTSANAHYTYIKNKYEDEDDDVDSDNYAFYSSMYMNQD